MNDPYLKLTRFIEGVRNNLDAMELLLQTAEELDDGLSPHCLIPVREVANLMESMGLEFLCHAQTVGRAVDEAHTKLSKTAGLEH